jgi:hypothetical protein
MKTSTLYSTGERAVCNDLQYVFVHGAYNLGPVYVNREIITTALHPGEVLSYPTGAAGEDNYLINPDEGISPIGIAEIDFNQISSCATDYAIADDIPGILFHWNPGALLRNVVCKDQVGDVADAGKLLTTSSGAAGALKILTEVALVDPAGAGTGEAYASGVTWGDQGSLHHNRTPMRQAYYQADASADYDVVAYILNT